MKIHKNAYFIGERVKWGDAQVVSRKAGTGRVDALYVGVADQLIYRVDRDRLDGSKRCELLLESELERADA